MTRGEVWWAELAGDAGFRPVVIVSRSDRLDRRRNVTIAEVTRVVRSLRCEVPLSRDDGLPTDCVINTDNLTHDPHGSIEATHHDIVRRAPVRSGACALLLPRS